MLVVRGSRESDEWPETGDALIEVLGGGLRAPDSRCWPWSAWCCRAAARMWPG